MNHVRNLMQTLSVKIPPARDFIGQCIGNI